MGSEMCIRDRADSDLNYKDALAVTGRPGVVRTTPLVAGIDVVGTVAESSDPRWRPGDWIVLNGAGLSETRNGGYATRARIDGELAVGLPDGLTAQQAAALGLADQFELIENAYAGADRMLGRPVKVTPSSKVVGDLALTLVAKGITAR